MLLRSTTNPVAPFILPPQIMTLELEILTWRDTSLLTIFRFPWPVNVKSLLSFMVLILI
ncbi:BnaC01g37730D [Brassica napus]|uniref:BnaC01g37730D protein n=2 Tax=Brassica TaxID=3705 RepID=A0A078GHT5_BRANA|nr:BnaC01g37730D [Brassica napus]